MTKLQSSPAARIALEWRKLEDRAAVVRGRVEALPRAYQDGPMRQAENRIALRQMDKARELLDGIDEKLEEHIEAQTAAELAAAGEEQARLLAERGIETFDGGTVKHRDGWQWLITRKPPRLTYDEIDAGNDYARLYALAMQDTLSISSNDNTGGDGDGREFAGLRNRRRMDGIQKHITEATGSTRLVALLDAICGRGDTLRHVAGGDDRKAAGYEAELKIGLQMVSVAFKIMREKDKKAAA